MIDNSYVLTLFGSSSSTSDSSSFLLNYFNSKAGITTSAAAATAAVNTSPTGSSAAPTSPWSSSDMPEESELVKAVMQGQSFINSKWVTSDVLNASEDYTKLFTIYQALTALEGVASMAQDTTLTASQLANYQKRFAAGLKEIQDYLADTDFDFVDLTQGVVTDELKSTVGTARTDPTYLATSIHNGATTDPVQAFEGNVVFSMSVQRLGVATPYEITFDLSEMGDTPRSMGNVVNYMNGKLEAADVDTCFAISTTAAVPETVVVNGKTVEVSAGRASYALQIKGLSYETVTLSAETTADAVYVAQSTGDAARELEDGEEAQTVLSQLLKFQDDGSTLSDPISKVGYTYYAGEAQQVDLSDSIVNVIKGAEVSDNESAPNALAVAASPDGGVYVLTNVASTTEGQEIKGLQDVALIRYDSAGNVVYTRTLGAADTATGYALAVSEDGRVAVVGSVTGALNIDNPTTEKNAYGIEVATGVAASTASLNGSSATVSDSFVTVFNAEGNEAWTQRLGATSSDQATTVTFGEDGQVIVGGKTQSLMPGATSASGGTDGYVVGFSATGQKLFTTQTGTAGTDQTSQLYVDGNTLYVASVENNIATLRTYDISTGQATLTGERALGGLGGGTISGLSVHEGKVYVGGSAASSQLVSGGQVTSAYSGGFDAYALSIGADLSDTTEDTIAYYGGTGAEQNAQVTFVDGKAWIAGSTTGAIDGTAQIGSGLITTTNTVRTDGYLVQLDIETGSIDYQKRYSGTDGVVTVNAISVASNGSSVLDKLGLPLGTIDYSDSQLLTANSSVRAGDVFYIVDPDTGSKKTITIEAEDTMKTLAQKITRASGYEVDVEVSKVAGKSLDQIVISPANGSSALEFLSGPAGKDALEALGISSGLVVETPEDGETQDVKNYGLELDISLNLNSTEAIAKAIESLQDSMRNIRTIYNYLKYGESDEDTTASKASSGTVPAYLTSQLANYQAGLNRLLGGA